MTVGLMMVTTGLPAWIADRRRAGVVVGRARGRRVHLAIAHRAAFARAFAENDLLQASRCTCSGGTAQSSPLADILLRVGERAFPVRAPGLRWPG